MKQKDFPKTRKWVVENVDSEPQSLLRSVYDRLYEELEEYSMCDAILYIADHSYKSVFVADQEINLLACFSHIMVDCKFK